MSPRPIRFAAPLLAALAVAGAASAGETRCWFDHGALVAPAAFGDIAGDFLIDPAEPVSRLHVTRALMSGIETATATRDLSLAGLTQPAVTLSVADLDARSAGFAASVNGVIGADLLSRFVVDIEPSPCRLRLTPPAAAAAARGLRLPVVIIGGRPTVVATITDGSSARTGPFAIGTGFGSTTIFDAGLSRPLPPDAAPPVRLRALEVGGRLFEQVPAVVGPASGDGVQGVIGGSVWSVWRLRLDIQDGWLELEPAQTK